MELERLRSAYHEVVFGEIVWIDEKGIPSFADRKNAASGRIASRIADQIGFQTRAITISGQEAGRKFEVANRDFLERSTALINHLRPGDWEYLVSSNISQFKQYEHLADLDRLTDTNPALKTAIGSDYLIKPDVVIARHPVSDHEINKMGHVVSEEGATASLTPLRQKNNSERLLLHASISSKWTMRSDRAQNARTEALNLIRNRKGPTPHIVVITAEPTPSRLASLALGTGDIDCVYHFALRELISAIQPESDDTQDLLAMMIDGNRLRDISDLPFDLQT